MKTFTILTIAIFPFLFGCVHAPPRCSVAIAHSATEYDVCIGSKDVSSGDRVAFYKEKCGPSSRGTERKCKNVKIGEGSILNTLDEHLSRVKLDNEFELSEGVTIQKKNTNQ